MEKKTYSVLYSISFLNTRKASVDFEVDNYASIYGAKDDISTQIRLAMKKKEIAKARLLVDVTISDSDGNFVDHDEVDVRYENETVRFLY